MLILPDSVLKASTIGVLAWKLTARDCRASPTAWLSLKSPRIIRLAFGFLAKWLMLQRSNARFCSFFAAGVLEIHQTEVEGGGGIGQPHNHMRGKLFFQGGYPRRPAINSPSLARIEQRPHVRPGGGMLAFDEQRLEIALISGGSRTSNSLDVFMPADLLQT